MPAFLLCTPESGGPGARGRPWPPFTEEGPEAQRLQILVVLREHHVALPHPTHLVYSLIAPHQSPGAPLFLLSDPPHLAQGPAREQEAMNQSMNQLINEASAQAGPSESKTCALKKSKNQLFEFPKQ